ncbi:MAG: hypothetical protein K2K47_10855 [Duncaniella sp.]|nr:hypothetical protein [Duncaniella sp.]
MADPPGRMERRYGAGVADPRRRDYGDEPTEMVVYGRPRRNGRRVISPHIIRFMYSSATGVGDPRSIFES